MGTPEQPPHPHPSSLSERVKGARRNPGSQLARVCQPPPPPSHLAGCAPKLRSSQSPSADSSWHPNPKRRKGGALRRSSHLLGSHWLCRPGQPWCRSSAGGGAIHPRARGSANKRRIGQPASLSLRACACRAGSGASETRVADEPPILPASNQIVRATLQKRPQGGQVGTKGLRLLGRAELLPAETWSLGDHLPASSVTPAPPQSWPRASLTRQ